MLAGFEHKVLGLFCVALWDILSDAFHRHLEHFLLVCLFLAHNLCDDLGSQALLEANLLEAASLRERRSAIIDLHLLQEVVLLLLVKIGKLHGGSKGNAPLVHIFKDFGDKVGKTDIALHRFLAVAHILANHSGSAVIIGLRYKLSRS